MARVTVPHSGDWGAAALIMRADFPRGGTHPDKAFTEMAGLFDPGVLPSDPLIPEAAAQGFGDFHVVPIHRLPFGVPCDEGENLSFFPCQFP